MRQRRFILLLILLILLAAAGCASVRQPAPVSLAVVSTPCPAPSPCPTSSHCPPGEDDCTCANYQPPPPYSGPEPDCGCQCNEGITCTSTSPLPPAPNDMWPACSTQWPTPCGIAAPQPGTVNFAVIGDWGDTCEQTCPNLVAAMVKSWNAYGLDFIITTGDNDYPLGTMHDLVTSMAFYSAWSPWLGGAAPGSCPQPGNPAPRFFPTLGNHDTYTGCGQPYLDYFCGLGAYSPTGTARYYNYARPDGLIEIFSLDANSSEPDGVNVCSKQALWLKGALARSTAAWKIIVFHEPPIGTSQADGFNLPFRQWPFAEWGASIVLMGHKHLYERIRDSSGLTWVINGLGGTSRVDAIRDATWGPAWDQGCHSYIWPGSKTRFNFSVGAMVGVATQESLRFCFLALSQSNPLGTCVDNFTLTNQNARK